LKHYRQAGRQATKIGEREREREREKKKLRSQYSIAGILHK
jgi:hypothetical protein